MIYGFQSSQDKSAISHRITSKGSKSGASAMRPSTGRQRARTRRIECEPSVGRPGRGDKMSGADAVGRGSPLPRERVRCVTFSDMDDTSPQPSPFRQGDGRWHPPSFRRAAGVQSRAADGGEPGEPCVSGSRAPLRGPGMTEWQGASDSPKRQTRPLRL